jgi:DNA-binding PadR family transcriptional regulator
LSIKHAILGLLADGGPLHGYGLKSAYEEELVPGAALNIGQVYPALDKLQEEGHVTVEVVSQSERPDRKVYTITDKGRRELEHWLATPSRQDLDLRNETFLKLVLAWRLSQRRQGTGGAKPDQVLAAERRTVLARLHEVTEARSRAEKEGAGVPSLLMLDLAILRLNAFHQWLDRCEEMFRKGQAPLTPPPPSEEAQGK